MKKLESNVQYVDRQSALGLMIDVVQSLDTSAKTPAIADQILVAASHNTVKVLLSLEPRVYDRAEITYCCVVGFNKASKITGSYKG